MANYEATRYDWDGQYLTSVEGVNTGVIIPWGSASIPSGFLECNGQSVSTSTYANLFAVIAYTYGGSGASFNVPDLQDKIIVNKSNTKTLAQTGGNNTVTPTGNVSASLADYTLTTAEMPSHTHTYPNASGGGEGMGPGNLGSLNPGTTANFANTGGGGAHGHTLNAANFVGSATSVLQPYLTLIYIIKT
jgi:microcystin-dependent protein